jgi:hypothetical protein
MQVDEDFETTIAHIDDLRRQAEIAACDRHLSDLVKAYGQPIARIQPPSYGRVGPRPGPARFPQREILASVF